MNQDKSTQLKPEQRYFQESIQQWMLMLDRELGHYCQTTHESMSPQGGGIDTVSKALTECYNEPTAFNISELSQCIRKWVKSCS